MPQTNNPFKPNSPVNPYMFAGREAEIDIIEACLSSTKEGNPKNLLLIGERGIGKTSVLLLADYLAKGEITVTDGKRLDYLTVYVSLDKRTGVVELSRRLMRSIERELRRSQELLQLLRDVWNFVKRIELKGFKVADKKEQLSESEIFDSLIYSLVDTAKLLKERGIANPGTSKSGIIILIDEADRAADELDLGALLKQLTEQLLFEGCNIISIIVSGLPETVLNLRKSHESSLRVFDQINLAPLTYKDCKKVIELALEHANRTNPTLVKITDSALNSIISFSEGCKYSVNPSFFPLGESQIPLDTSPPI